MLTARFHKQMALNNYIELHLTNKTQSVKKNAIFNIKIVYITLH